MAPTALPVNPRAHGESCADGWVYIVPKGQSQRERERDIEREGESGEEDMREKERQTERERELLKSLSLFMSLQT